MIYSLGQPFKLHKIEDGPSTHVSVSRDDALVYYKQMQTIRRMETAAGICEFFDNATCEQLIKMQLCRQSVQGEDHPRLLPSLFRTGQLIRYLDGALNIVAQYLEFS